MKSNGLQQRAASDVELELRQPPAARDVHLVLGLLGLERGVLHRAVVVERQGHRLVEREQRLLGRRRAGSWARRVAGPDTARISTTRRCLALLRQRSDAVVGWPARCERGRRCRAARLPLRARGVPGGAFAQVPANQRPRALRVPARPVTVVANSPRTRRPPLEQPPQAQLTQLSGARTRARPRRGPAQSPRPRGGVRLARAAALLSRLRLRDIWMPR